MILSSFGVTLPPNLECSAFRKRILPLTRSRPAVPYGACCYLATWLQIYNELTMLQLWECSAAEL